MHNLGVQPIQIICELSLHNCQWLLSFKQIHCKSIVMFSVYITVMLYIYTFTQTQEDIVTNDWITKSLQQAMENYCKCRKFMQFFAIHPAVIFEWLYHLWTIQEYMAFLGQNLSLRVYLYEKWWMSLLKSCLEEPSKINTWQILYGQYFHK